MGVMFGVTFEICSLMSEAFLLVLSRMLGDGWSMYREEQTIIYI